MYPRVSPTDAATEAVVSIDIGWATMVEVASNATWVADSTAPLSSSNSASLHRGPMVSIHSTLASEGDTEGIALATCRRVDTHGGSDGGGGYPH